MINRFHNAAPPAVVLNSNSTTAKTKVVDDFGLLLNALTGPLPQEQQASSGLPEQHSKAKQELNSPAIPFERTIDLLGPAVDQADQLFPNAPLSSSAANLSPQNLPSTLNAETHFPQVAPELNTASLQIPTANSSGNMRLAEYLPVIASQQADKTPVLQPIDSAVTSLLDGISPSPASTQSSDVQEVVTNADNGFDTETIGLEILDTSAAQVISSKYSQAPGADVETVAVPWRLQANAALSYQSIATKLQNVDDQQNVSSTPIPVALAKPGSKDALQGFANNAPSFDGLEIDKALQFYRIAEAASTLANLFENARIQRADSRASFVMWPQRVLHWLADGDATTAWVRDYQLDASGTKTLIDALRCFADQQGFSLSRIMLNGHEAWRSPSTF